MTWPLIALKDLRVLCRDGMALFWVLGFPLLFAGFFGSVMRAGVDADTVPMHVVVIDDPENPLQAQLITNLQAANLRVSPLPLEQARTTVTGGKALAYLLTRNADGLSIDIRVDPARRAEAAVLEGVALRALASAILPPEFALPQVHTEPIDAPGASASAAPHNGYEIVFPAMIMWGLMGCAATFAVAIVSEISSGTLLRLRAAPVHQASILGGKAAACIVACLFDTLLLSLLAHLLLDVRIEHGLKFAAALTAAALCFSGLTMILSVLGRSEQSVAGAGWSTLIVLAMLGGAMVPLSVMPPWLQEASGLSPVQWGIMALEGATWRAFGWSDLARHLVPLAALGLSGFGVGAAVLHVRRL